MGSNTQLKKSTKKWNEEIDLTQWETFYYEDNYNGNRLRARENKLLELFDRLNLKKGSKILELGYGAGITSAKICGRGYNLVGVDVSEKLTELAIKNCNQVPNSNFKFIVDNAEQLSFPENSFEGVIGLGFLQYLEYPSQCFKEVERVLKPGGFFIIGQRNMFGISSIDGPTKWIRVIYYLFTNRRHELRWQDTFIIYPAIGLATLLSPFFNHFTAVKRRLNDHLKIGHVKKNAWSHQRIKRLMRKANLKVIKTSGAGYLSKKSKYFPNTAKKLDCYLQSLNDSGKNKWIRKMGNSVVFLAQKKN